VKTDIFLKKVRQLCKDRGISISKLLTGELKMTAGAVTAWKNGRSAPKSDTIDKIAKYFGCPVKYLLDDSEKVLVGYGLAGMGSARLAKDAAVLEEPILQKYGAGGDSAVIAVLQDQIAELRRDKEQLRKDSHEREMGLIESIKNLSKNIGGKVAPEGESRQRDSTP
jgi:transcriptional regulator with XRE-family HTH domain